MDGHAPRTIGLKAFPGGDGQRLDPVWIPWPTWHMDLRRRDCRSRAAMDVTFEISDCLLPGRVIAERDVDVRVNQAGDKGRAAGVDHNVGGFDSRSGRCANRNDKAVFTNDGIARNDRITPIAGDDFSDVDDRDAHVVSLVRWAVARITVSASLNLAHRPA